MELPDLLAGIFHLLRIAMCSSSLNGSDPEQMSERQRMKTLPGCRRHMECCFDSEPVYLQTDQKVSQKHTKIKIQSLE